MLSEFGGTVRNNAVFISSRGEKMHGSLKSGNDSTQRAEAAPPGFQRAPSGNNQAWVCSI